MDNKPVQDFVSYFEVFNNNNTNTNINNFSNEDILEVMLNIDVIDEEIFNKYNINIICRLNYYECMINVFNFLSGDILNYQKIDSLYYCCMHFELYKHMLYRNSLDFFKSKGKDYCMRDYLLNTNLLNKLFFNKMRCEHIVKSIYNTIIANYDKKSDICIDLKNLIIENGNILNLS